MAGAAGLLLCVALVWAAVRTGWTEATDVRLLRALASADGSVWSPITRAGDTVTRFAAAAVCAALLWVRGRAGAALFLGVAVAGGAAFNEGLKALAARARPDLLPRLDDAHGLSFPSGHSAGALVLAGAFALLVPSRRRPAALALAALFALLVGTSRVALAVHWPSDVLAGWLAGGAWMMLMVWAFGPQPRATTSPPSEA